MKWAGIITISAGAVFLLYIYTQPAYTHRFRLTIEIQTPDGTRSGSSVIETSAWESGSWGPIEARGIRRNFTGRAVFVDLGRGRNLTALLGFGARGGQDKLYKLTSAALAPGKQFSWQEEFRLRGRGVLPPDDIPTLITFGDLNDPASAVLVDPSDITRYFGPGFAFGRAILETTNESVSENIARILPWWRRPDGRRRSRIEHGEKAPLWTQRSRQKIFSKRSN